MKLTEFEFDGRAIEWVEDELGQPAVNACEAAKLLGFKGSGIYKAINSVDPQFRFQQRVGTVGRPPWWLHEPGFYQLIFQSRSAIAIEFQRWLLTDVLPGLRSSGQYGYGPGQRERLIKEMRKLRIYHRLS